MSIRRIDLNFVFFDRTVCTANIDTLFYRYCLLRQPSLIKYFFGRWIFGLLHIFGLVREERFYNRRWRFLKSVRGPLNRAEKFWQRRRPKVYDLFPGEANLWITRWPEAIMLPLANKHGAVLIAPSFDLVDGRFAHYEDTASLYKRALKTYRPKLAADAPRELIPTGLETVHVYRGHVFKTARRCRAAQFGHGFLIFLVLLILGIFLGIAGLYFGTASYSPEIFSSILSRPLTAVLNLLPSVMLVFFFYFIFNRVWFAFSLTALGTLALSLTSWYKLAARGDPFIPMDLHTLSDVFPYFPKNAADIDHAVLLVVAICIVLSIITGLLVSSRIVSPKLRFSGIFAALCLIIFSYFTLYTNDSIYASASVALPAGQETEAYVSRGCTYPFLHGIKTAHIESPDGYDELRTVKSFSRYVTENIPIENRVSIICVMLDDFADFSSSLDMTNDVYRPLHMLQKDSLHGTLITDVFGSGSEITERSVLTGNPADTYYRSDTSSYVRYFAGQGYYTEAVIASEPELFNRRNVSEFLGFENCSFLDAAAAMDAECLFDEVRTRFETYAESSGGPYFSFSLIGERSYPADENLYRKTYIAPGTLTDEELNVLNNYLGGIETVAQGVSDLADYFDSRTEPVILIVFGGHLPDLGDDVFAAIGANISADKTDGFIRRYGTPYLIHANASAEYVLDTELNGEGRMISPCFLFNEAFSHIGWGGTAYLKVAGELSDIIPVIHTSGKYILSDGNVTRTLDEEQSSLLAFYRETSYYRRMNYADYR